MTSPASVASELVAFCIEQLEALAARHLPDLQLPGSFAGHAVGADVRADLLFTLGHLGDAGVGELAGRRVDDHIVGQLARVDGAATHTFFSYRVAETVARSGAFEGNPLLGSLSLGQRQQVALACDSTSWIELLDRGALPRNYAAVLARCELARATLGLDTERAVLDSLVQRVAAVLGSNALRYLDDSNDASGRYDIYTADVWLFCEPLAPLLGDLWHEGIASALDLVDAVGCRDGSAVAWGRSTGVLAVALTIELAACVVERGLVPDRAGAWLARAADAVATLDGWFSNGVITAHQHRDQDRYRGPARRLQLTLDVLGKLAWAAKALQLSGESTGATAEPYPAVDRLIAFETERRAAVWAHRRRGLEFALPFVGAARSHYYPAPHAPGCFEVPVDADLPCWTPIVIASGARYAGGGLPESLEHAPGTIAARWDGFPATAFDWHGTAPPKLPGTRRTTYRVERRSISVDEQLEFGAAPDVVSVLVPERAGRPLHVEFTSPGEHTSTKIDVRGVAEWRSSWSEFAWVHQLDLVPSARVEYSLQVTPKLRVASTAHGHHYHRSLYGPLADRVVDVPSPLGPLGDKAIRLDDIDLFHLHWPEWSGFDDHDTHAAMIESLRSRDIPIVWTAHNLTPHDRNRAVYDPIYQLWAGAADAVIHHSHWGEQRMRAAYRFRDDCRQVVIEHGHFGELWREVRTIDRAAVEAELGTAPCRTRIGIVGAPRIEKKVAAFLEGFAASSRDDLQLACWSLAPDDVVPDDPRIVIAEQYRGVSERDFARRLALCDLLALPFDPDGEMLATGTAADAIGLGLPALCSDWAFLRETLGDGAIVCGHTAAAIAECLDALSNEQVTRARVASLRRRDELGWPALADRTFELFEDVVSGDRRE